MPRLSILILLFLFASCNKKHDDFNVTGMKPTYISYNDLLQFEQQPPQPVLNAGQILLYHNYVFLGEINKGIHVIDMTDTIHPVNIYFLKIPGNKDEVAQNDRLYADNGPHLLTLDISDIHHITLIERAMNVFRPSEMYPLDYSGYFECVDESKGWVVDWEEASLDNPRCKTAFN
jgi:hypothetical protein